MSIGKFLDMIDPIFFDSIIIGTEETTLWIYSYNDLIPPDVLRLGFSRWTVETRELATTQLTHLVIYI